MAYSKQNLIEDLTLHNEINSKAHATRIVDFIFERIKDSIIAGEDTTIPLIGTAVIINKAERTCIKPGTTEKMVVPAKKAVKVKITAPLKRAVN